MKTGFRVFIVCLGYGFKKTDKLNIFLLAITKPLTWKNSARKARCNFAQTSLIYVTKHHVFVDNSKTHRSTNFPIFALLHNMYFISNNSILPQWGPHWNELNISKHKIQSLKLSDSILSWARQGRHIWSHCGAQTC